MPEDSVLNLKKETKNWIYETILENNQHKLIEPVEISLIRQAHQARMAYRACFAD